jgi:hypothetical protein
MAVANTSSLSTHMKTYYVKEFLDWFREVLVVSKYGQDQPIPRAGGKTANWFRYHPLAKITAAGTEGQTTDNLTFATLASMTVEATVEVWYNALQVSDLLKMQSRDPALEGVTELLAVNAAESVERQTIYTLAEHNIWPLPALVVNQTTGALYTAAYEEKVAVTAATSTTVLAATGCTASCGGDDLWIGGWLTVSKGQGYGHCSRISDFATSGTVFTIIDALPESATSAGDYATEFTVASPFHAADAVGSGDRIHTHALQKAEEILFKNGAKPYGDGYFVGAVTPEVYRVLLNDSTWKTAIQYDQGSEGLRRNEVGIWSRTRFFRMTTIPGYLQDTTGAFNTFTEDGTTHITFIMGRDSFGTLILSGNNEPQLIIKTPGPQDTSNPLDLYSTAGWKFWWKTVPLNANWCVGLFSSTS